MSKIETIIAELKKIAHGFKPMIAAGDELLHISGQDHLALARSLLEQEAHQARMLGTYMLGELAAHQEEALKILREKVSKDGSWQVQEMLAKAFDRYCSHLGYENALPIIKAWLQDGQANVKRAVIEGLRIWTGRPYFREHPQVAIDLIGAHRSADSEYLRKSVGNALRDIKKKHPEQVESYLANWDLTDRRVLFTKKLIEK
jgi:DNA alkylation repair enzyme